MQHTLKESTLKIEGKKRWRNNQLYVWKRWQNIHFQWWGTFAWSLWTLISAAATNSNDVICVVDPSNGVQSCTLCVCNCTLNQPYKCFFSRTIPALKPIHVFATPVIRMDLCNCWVDFMMAGYNLILRSMFPIWIIGFSCSITERLI